MDCIFFSDLPLSCRIHERLRETTVARSFLSPTMEGSVKTVRSFREHGSHVLQRGPHMVHDAHRMALVAATPCFFAFVRIQLSKGLPNSALLSSCSAILNPDHEALPVSLSVRCKGTNPTSKHYEAQPSNSPLSPIFAVTINAHVTSLVPPGS